MTESDPELQVIITQVESAMEKLAKELSKLTESTVFR